MHLAAPISKHYQKHQMPFLGVSKTVMASSYGSVFTENNAGGFVRVY